MTCLLVGKMELYGVDEKGIRWVKDYLKDRAQYVSIGGTRSKIRHTHRRLREGPERT